MTAQLLMAAVVATPGATETGALHEKELSLSVSEEIAL